MRAILFLLTLTVALLAHAGAAGTPVEFRGANSYSSEQLNAPLAEQIADVAEHGLTPARADDVAFFLGSFYRKQGFARAEVSYQIQGGRLILVVQEGPRALLRSLRFEGNASYDAAKLAEFLAGVTPECLDVTPILLTMELIDANDNHSQ